MLVKKADLFDIVHNLLKNHRKMSHLGSCVFVWVAFWAFVEGWVQNTEQPTLKWWGQKLAITRSLLKRNLRKKTILPHYNASSGMTSVPPETCLNFLFVSEKNGSKISNLKVRWTVFDFSFFCRLTLMHLFFGKRLIKNLKMQVTTQLTQEGSIFKLGSEILDTHNFVVFRS